MKDHLDNDKEEIQQKLWSALRTDKRADTYVIPTRVMELISEVALAHTQSKLKAFAGEVEEAIGEEIMCYDSTDISHKFMGCDTCQSNMKNYELRQALKAIKEKAGIE